MSVSIHAPSRERLDPAEEAYAKALISIHAPSRERPKLMLTFCCKVIISIHAPSRERLLIQSVSQIHRYFNPRSLAGATMLISIGTFGRTFQSTLPYGSEVVNLF